MNRIEQILAALAALTAEVQALQAEQQPAPDAPEVNWGTIEFSDDGWSKEPGPNGGFLPADIVDLRRQLGATAAGPNEAEAQRAKEILDHPNLTNAYVMTQLSPERWAQLRTEYPEVYIDHYQNVVLGRLIIPGGGSKPSRDFDRTLTIPRALDYSAIGAGHVGLLPGVLKDTDSKSADEYARKIGQWAQDVFENGWPDFDTSSPAPELPEGEGRIDPVVYLSVPGGIRRIGRDWDAIFGKFQVENRQARIGLSPGQYVSIPFVSPRPTRVKVSVDGMPVEMDISEVPGELKASTKVSRGSGSWKITQAGVTHYLTIAPRLTQGQAGGWVLVTVR